MGIATPTESASVGAVGAAVIAALKGQLNYKNIRDVSLTLNPGGVRIGTGEIYNSLQKFHWIEDLENLIQKMIIQS